MAKFLKELIKGEMTASSQELEGSVLVDFRGLNAKETEELRTLLREKGAQMNVVLNRLYLKALMEKDKEVFDSQQEALKTLFKGPTAVVFGDDGAITPAKVLVEWQKTHDKMSIKGGFLDRKALNAEDIEALSRIPGREVLLGQVVSGIASPLSGFVSVLSGVLRNLLNVLNAVKDKKEEE